MRKLELAKRLVDISESMVRASSMKTASDVSNAKRETAARMIVLAKQLMGFDMTKEFEASVKAVGSLAQQFKDTHADLIQQINEAEKALKEKEDLLQAYYKDWATNSGYKPLRSAVLQQAQQCMAIGDTLDNLAEELKIQRRESEAESYKEKYNILVSTLNEAELLKFSRILNSFFKKQTTEIKTGLSALDGAIKEWHESAQEIAKERGVKLPKASDEGVKQANVFEDIADAIQSFIPKLVQAVRDVFADIMMKITRNGRELDDMDNQLGQMVSKARSVL